MTAEERKLKKALDESLTKKIDQVPSIEELQEKHIFTESFRLFMVQLIRKQETHKRNRNDKKYFYGLLKAVACIVCIVGIGTLAFDLLSIPMGGGTKSDSLSGGSMSNNHYEEESPAAEESKSENTIAEEADQGAAIAEDTAEAEQGETGTGGKGNTVLWEASAIKNDDNSYTIEFTLKNLTDRKVTYTPVYEWTYEVSGQERNQAVEEQEEKAYILNPNETIVENYNDINFFNDMESGGILTAKRSADGEEISCFVRVR